MASFIERSQVGNTYLFFEAAPGPHMLLLCTERRTGPAYPYGEGDPDNAAAIGTTTDGNPDLALDAFERVTRDMERHLWATANEGRATDEGGDCEHGLPRRLCLKCGDGPDHRLFGGAWPWTNE